MSEQRNIAVVTGASRGIGRAVAQRFAESGYEVWALARTSAALESLRAEVQAKGGTLRVLQTDVTQEKDIFRACDAVLKEASPRVLVNNAGVALSAPLARTSLEDFDRVMSINVRAAFLFCRQLMPPMALAGYGRVINVASTAALKGFRYTSAYSASKHALLGLTRSIALEFAAKQVTVNAVCPGWTDTDMVSTSAQAISKATGRSQEESVKALAEMNPLKRLIKPEEVADLCLFLASPAGAAVTGAAYTMDGGESA